MCRLPWPAWPRITLLLAALCVCPAPSQTLFDLQYMTKYPPGCFHTGKEMSDVIAPQSTGTDTTTGPPLESLEQCQMLAQRTEGAKYFTYYPFSGACTFSSETSDSVTYRKKGAAISGFSTCPTLEELTNDGACMADLPGPGFPGETVDGAMRAWPAGRQPSSLECWPENWVGQKLGCKEVKVLEDTDTGWPGTCMGLQRKELHSNTTCEQDCRANSSCASWQIGLEGNCWQGVGTDCYWRPGFAPGGAQRLQHGRIRVLLNLTGWQIVGLAKVFDNSHGYFATDANASAACKYSCYSDIHCQFWQYAPDFGCFMEMRDMGYRVAYPLTRIDSAFKTTEFAANCIAGEYLQHICPRGHSIEIPEPAAPEVVRQGCAKVGYRWDPNIHKRTVEAGGEGCRARCQKTNDCLYWSYWPDGGCHLQNKDAKIRIGEDWRVISGTSWCQHTGQNDTGSPDHGWLTPEGQEALDASRYKDASDRSYGKQVLETAVTGPAYTMPPTPRPTPRPTPSPAPTPKPTDEDHSVALGTTSGSDVMAYWPVLPVLAVLCCGGIAGGFFYSSMEQKKDGRRARNTKMGDNTRRSGMSEPAPMTSREFSRDSDGDGYYYSESSSSYGGDSQVWEAEPDWQAPSQQPGYDPPGYDQPGYDQLAHDQRDYDQPGYDQSGYDRPHGGYGQSGRDQSGYDRLGRGPSDYDQRGYNPPYNGYGGGGQPGMGDTVASINRSSTRVCMSPEMEDFRYPQTGAGGEFTV